jgi:H+/Cl- antiporter ClcA
MRNILSRMYHSELAVIAQSVVTGLLVGFAVAGMRLILNLTQTARKELYDYLKTSPEHIVLWVIALGIAGILLGLGAQRRPMIRGSGIPQIKGYLNNSLDLRWRSELPLKWLCAVTAISAGLSLGREGPCVQIGAYIGIGLLAVARRGPAVRHTLVCSASAAGLSAAFSAPLSGVLFALEELQTPMHPLFLACALGASAAADAGAGVFLGLQPVFRLQSITSLPYALFPWIILLGVLCAILGDLFKRLLYAAQDMYGKIGIPQTLRPILPLIVSVPLSFFLAETTGGGHEFIVSLTEREYSFPALAVIFGVKLLFSALCFGSGVAGGIFLPFLTCGALTGILFGKVLTVAGIALPEEGLTFLVLGMAAFFGAVVKAPVTGIVLILELTANMNHFTALVCAVFSAFASSEMIRSRPVYSVLLDRMNYASYSAGSRLGSDSSPPL